VQEIDSVVDMNNLFKVILLVLCINCGVLAQQEDMITYLTKSSPPEQATTYAIVISETCKEVRFKIGVVEQSLPADRVIEIIYAEVPRAYEIAQGAMAEGNFKKAIKKFNRAIQKAKGVKRQRWVYQYATYYKALCYLQMGKMDSALATFEELKQKMPNTRFLLDINRTIYQIYKRKKAKRKAKEFMRKFERELVRYKVPKKLWVDEMELLKIDLEEFLGNYKSALRGYEKAFDKYQANIQMCEKIIFGIFGCLKKLKDEEKIKEWAEKLAKDEKIKSERIRTFAYNILGDMDYNRGNYKDALFNYLRGVVEFNRSAPGEPPKINPENEYSLRSSCLCIAKLYAMEKDKEYKLELKSRFERLMKELRTKYPNSKYLKEVQKAYKTLT
jgi:tetratricopeptide (TPR) repeat protein